VKITKILEYSVEKACELPLYETKVQAGFPSPVNGYMCNRLDLNKHLIKYPKSTFFVQVTGESMIDAGIYIFRDILAPAKINNNIMYVGF